MHVFRARSTSNVIHRTGGRGDLSPAHSPARGGRTVSPWGWVLGCGERNFISLLVLLLHSDSEKTMKWFPAPTLVVQSEHTSWRNQAILCLVSHPLFFRQLLQNYIHCSANNWPLWYLRDCDCAVLFLLALLCHCRQAFHSLNLFCFFRETPALLQQASR